MGGDDDGWRLAGVEAVLGDVFGLMQEGVVAESGCGKACVQGEQGKQASQPASQPSNSRKRLSGRLLAPAAGRWLMHDGDFCLAGLP